MQWVISSFCRKKAQLHKRLLTETLGLRQIEEFHKFIAALKESDQLCIIGYHFNSEDNHVNAIIGDWLRAEKKHRLIYFNWKGGVKLSKLKWMETFEIKENGDVADLRSTDYQIIRACSH